ncbi:hypothetical protein C3486_21630 [Streptomyces sp. Ru73]|uniref:eCIS core domain-containing protein n=1 Tax=Streptomyces sp. Ru73 TaxID=2080748 RepID=UPI000CDDF8F5|nr:DUF4157 domain-containing protein [Streptomyces sp. Ru73]POX38705.1 hypothetical protein C3486_21630 [Streptomyces sp. Ru73]
MNARRQPGSEGDREHRHRPVPSGAAQQSAHGTPSGTASGPEAVLRLQRLAGNAAVSRAVEEARHEHGPGCGHPAADEGPAVQRSAVHSVLGSAGRPLDEPVRTEMEARLGADFRDVRVHDDAAARRSAAEVGARAYTSGSHVVLGEGGGDRHTLAHELTHVIQQRQGPVAGTDNGQGLKVSDPSDAFERAAEANAARVMSGPVPVRQPETEEDPAAGGPAPTVSRAVQRAYTGKHSVSYGRLVGGAGSSMKAELHPKSIGRGSSPSVKPSWWPTGSGATAQWFARQMVQGHLLNENLGGPGNTLTNLTPLTKTGNSNHLHYAEKNVKREIAAGNIVEYEVTAHYGKVTGAELGATGQVAADIDANYATLIPEYLACDVTVYDAQGTWLYGESWQVHNTK